MPKFASLFTENIGLYRSNYSRDMISFTYSLANALKIFVWVIIVVVPFIICFSKGKPKLFSNLTHIL